MINKFISTLFLLLLLTFCSCSSTKQVAESSEKVDMTTMPAIELEMEAIKGIQKLEDTKTIISALASDDFGGRKPATEGYAKAVSYVSAFLRDNGIKPLRNGSYQDTLMADGNETYNVVGLIKSASGSDDYVMICAHLDHLGPAKGDDKIYNGANDNASGVTATLQVARALANSSFDQNIIVALFAAEEMGLVGSKHLAQRLRTENVNLTHVFNFEMIGKTLSTGPNQVYITGYKKSNMAAEMNKAVGFEFVKFLPAAIKYQLFSRSDNFPFYAEFAIPSQTISTFDFTNYNHYHKATDEVKLLDLENMHEVINTSTLAISRILKNNMVKMNED